MSSVWLTRACALRKICHYCRWELCNSMPHSRQKALSNYLQCCCLTFCCCAETTGRVKHMWPEVNKSTGLKVCVCVFKHLSVLYMCVCVCMTFLIYVYTFLLCVRGSWCVCVIWVYVSDRSSRLTVLSEKLIGPPPSGVEIVQLTPSKAKEQPCFLEAASPLKFYWFWPWKAF